MGTNGLKYVILEEIDFDLHEIRFCTDSKIALSYIKNSSQRFSVNIMNRLHEIKLNSYVNEWSFIQRKNNHADQCTRYNPITSLTPNSLWIKGPQFLYKSESVSFRE